MPLVRITLQDHHSEKTTKEISQAVHSSLIQEFAIPPDDYFHIVEPVKKSNLFYPEHYLKIKHTENIVFIHITAAAGRTSEQKKRLYKLIAEKISSTTDILKSDVIIVLVENNGKENWSFGNGEIQELKHLL